MDGHRRPRARSGLGGPDPRHSDGTPQTPEDLTGMAVFLAGPGSDYITGQSFNVEGGLVMS